jgi:hypothetical protein
MISQWICGPSELFFTFCMHIYPARIFIPLVSCLSFFFFSLCGYPPFYADNAPALFKKIMDVQYDFDDPSWDDVSEDGQFL